MSDNRRKICILHIAEAPGGVERYLVTLLTKLKQNYSDVFEQILVCSEAYDREKFKDLVDEIECVREMQNAIQPVRDLKAIQKVRKLIKKFQPDIVYCHSSKAGAIGRIANMGLKNGQGKHVYCIYNAHGWAFNMKGTSPKKLFAYVLIEKMLAPLADCIVCISEFEKKSALDHGICYKNTAKLKVIYNGIDFTEYNSVHIIDRNQLGIPSDAFVVGTTGRLAKQKAPDVFVKAAAEIKKIIDNAYFVIVGDGALLEETEELIHELGLENSFLITGWVNNPLDYIGNFDVAMLLSRWEGFGLVLPEYMITGKPIVATKVDAIPELIQDEVNGLLVDMDDFNGAADSVIRLKEDLELRSRLIENGKRIVRERFDVERVGREHSELFRGITDV